jgi:hypothetical protein
MLLPPPASHKTQLRPTAKTIMQPRPLRLLGKDAQCRRSICVRFAGLSLRREGAE